jgi:hypothetical protein
LIIVRKKASKKDNEEIETQDIQLITPPESIPTPEPKHVPIQQQDEIMEE